MTSTYPSRSVHVFCLGLINPASLHEHYGSKATLVSACGRSDLNNRVLTALSFHSSSNTLVTRLFASIISHHNNLRSITVSYPNSVHIPTLPGFQIRCTHVATFCCQRDCSLGSVLWVLDVGIRALVSASYPIRRPSHRQTGTPLSQHSIAYLVLLCIGLYTLNKSHLVAQSMSKNCKVKLFTINITCQQTLRKVSDFMLDGPSPLGIKRYSLNGTVCALCCVVTGRASYVV